MYNFIFVCPRYRITVRDKFARKSLKLRTANILIKTYVM